VRAGLAAGRLLDGQGLATMFVKTSQPPAQHDGAPARKGASAHPGEVSPPSADSPSPLPSPLSQRSTSSRDPFPGKVIPFRSPAPLDP
jgi:hypothetical protein